MKIPTAAADAKKADLAKEFSRLIRRDLTATQLMEANARNANNADKSICHTHDFIDANMTMAEAFKNIIGHSPEVHQESASSREDVVLWNGAWDIANAENFFVTKMFKYAYATTVPEYFRDWDDVSWNNDASASCQKLAPTRKHPNGGWRLWAQPDNKSEWELPDNPRFQLDRIHDLANGWDEDAGDNTVLSSNDIADIIAVVAQGVK